jgi:hypothetical protein
MRNIAPFHGRDVIRPQRKGGTMQDEATAQLEPHYLSRADAAAYVAKKFGFPCSEQTLAKLAVKRQGPQFKRANGRFAVYPCGAWMHGPSREFPTHPRRPPTRSSTDEEHHKRTAARGQAAAVKKPNVG